MNVSENLRGDLAHFIADYISQRPSRNLAFLAKRTKLGYATIRRLANQTGNPSFETVWTLLQFILGASEAKTYLMQHFPQKFPDVSMEAQPAYQPNSMGFLVNTIKDVHLTVEGTNRARRIMQQAIQEIQALQVPNGIEDSVETKLVLLFQKSKAQV